MAGLTNPAIERRVDDLISKMTLDEKLGQLIQVGCSDEAWLPSAAQNLTGAEVGKRFREQIEKGACGSLIGCRGLKTYNELQEAAAKSRLGIPLLVGHDMIHSAQTVAQISRPRRELKRFEKVTLRPGETKTVSFELGPDDLGYFCGRKWLVEKGRFVAWIAADSDAGRPLRFEYR